MHLNGSLIIRRRGEDLALFRRNGGVSFNNLCGNTAHGFNTEAQRCNVQQQDTLDIAAEHAALNCRADRNTFVGVNAFERFMTHEGFNSFLYSGDSRRTADHQHLVDLACGKTGILERLTDRPHGGFDQIRSHFIELCAGQSGLQMLRTCCICGNEGQADLRGGYTRKLNFRFFSGFLQALHRHFIGTQVNALLFLKFVCQPVDDALVEVVAAQTVVTRRGKHFLHAVAHFNDRNIERTAAEVIHHNLLVVLFVDTVGKRRRCRLIDNTFYIQARNFARVLRRLTLCVGEIGGNGDDRFRHLTAEVRFRVRFQLLQGHCGDFLRGVIFIADGDLIVRTHVALDGSDCAVGVGDCLSFGNLTDHSFAVL